MSASDPIKPSGGYNNIQVDYINEQTPAAGVTIDGLLIKDGYPELGASTNWTPTWTNLTSVSLSFARYITLGNFRWIWVKATGTTAGATSITFTLPAGNAVYADTHLACGVADTSNIAGLAYVSAGNCTVRRYDGAAFGSGASRVVYVSGCYEIA